MLTAVFDRFAKFLQHGANLARYFFENSSRLADKDGSCVPMRHHQYSSFCLAEKAIKRGFHLISNATRYTLLDLIYRRGEDTALRSTGE